ncbi:TetR family transcriptional regulator [Acidiferrobacter sp. SPIII_3]|nr:TetR family transcriptional regulator [Acidiferrobacter sp. SPIII_3]
MPVTGSLAPCEPLIGDMREPWRQTIEQRILEAAEEDFARAGFAGARTAAIAARAGIPKANLHYYFKTKAALYRAVLDRILSLWLSETDIIRAEVAPSFALEHYIRAKMVLAMTHPQASRVFAHEILHGAPHIKDYLRTELRRLVTAKSRVIEGWVAAGLMAPIDPPHLFFTIWAATQTYADFDSQVCAVLGVRHLDAPHQTRAADHVVTLILRGCGLENAPIKARPFAVRRPRKTAIAGVRIARSDKRHRSGR